MTSAALDENGSGVATSRRTGGGKGVGSAITPGEGGGSVCASGSTTSGISSEGGMPAQPTSAATKHASDTRTIRMRTHRVSVVPALAVACPVFCGIASKAAAPWGRSANLTRRDANVFVMRLRFRRQATRMTSTALCRTDQDVSFDRFRTCAESLTQDTRASSDRPSRDPCPDVCFHRARRRLVRLDDPTRLNRQACALRHLC